MQASTENLATTNSPVLLKRHGGDSHKLTTSACLFLISLYRTFGSLWLGGACRFEPSCSCYAEKAFRTLPLRRAVWVAFKRLSKCHPFGPQGYDPL